MTSSSSTSPASTPSSSPSSHSAMILLLRKHDPTMDLTRILSQPTCRLLSLPAELRTAIWELVLIQNTRKPPVFFSSYLFTSAPETLKIQRRFCANILRTCKQIYAEGTPIFYGDNQFLAHPSLLASLPSLLLYTHPTKEKHGRPVTHPRVAKMIRRYYVHVRLDIDPRFTQKQAEESFTGIEELEIDVFQAMYGGCDFSVLKMFEGVRGVGKVVIDGSLGDRKYADWLSSCMILPIGSEVEPYSGERVAGIASWDAWAKGMR